MTSIATANTLANQLDAILESNIVFFEYQKINGTTRLAIGTRHPKHIPKMNNDAMAKMFKEMSDALQIGLSDSNLYSKDIALQQCYQKIASILHPSEKSKIKDLTCVQYYDIGSNGWRKCRNENIVAIKQVVLCE